MNRKIVFALGAVIIFQVLVLIGEYVNAAMPLWTGKEIRLKTTPVDPRSLFRGNYVRLNYDISRLDATLFSDPGKLRNGEKVYILLRLNDAGVYEFSGVSLKVPEKGTFIRGRVQYYFYDANASHVRIKYGIEAYFAPKQKALELEQNLRDGGVAVLMVAPNGKAALKAVIGSELLE